MESMIIQAVLGIVAGMVKNPARAAHFRETLLTIRDTISILFPDSGHTPPNPFQPLG
jgi:hypothetical protein